MKVNCTKQFVRVGVGVGALLLLFFFPVDVFSVVDANANDEDGGVTKAAADFNKPTRFEVVQ